MEPYELMSEAELQEAVARYLVTEYPEVMFHSDYGAGTKLTFNQAKRQKRQNGGRRSWPDMFIAEPMAYASTKWSNGDNLNRLCEAFSDQADEIYCGLFLELKKPGTRLKKKNGEWATPHIAEQAKVLGQLRQRGYCAEFAVGFEEAKRIIDEYLGGQTNV